MWERGVLHFAIYVAGSAMRVGSPERASSSLGLVESTLELPDLPGRTPLSLMIPINQRFDPSFPL